MRYTRRELRLIVLLTALVLLLLLLRKGFYVCGARMNSHHRWRDGILLPERIESEQCVLPSKGQRHMLCRCEDK